MADVTKVTVNLPTALVEDLKAIAAANSTTMTDAIGQSIRINKYLLDQENANAKLLIETPQGRIERLIRR
jgi:hypothetical protein